VAIAAKHLVPTLARVTSLIQRQQRRALVLLTWLVLALSVAPAAGAQPDRAHPAMIAAASGAGVAAHRRGVPVHPLAAAARVGVESAVLVRGAPSERGAAEVASSAPHAPPPRGAARLYLKNCRFLC